MITAGRSQVAAVQGQPFPMSLQCGTNLRGIPFPTVQWKSSNGTVVTSGGRYAVDNGPSNVQLNLSNVDRSSNGTWMCILSNGILSSVVVNISLFVLGKDLSSLQLYLLKFSHSATISSTKCDRWSPLSHKPQIPGVCELASSNKSWGPFIISVQSCSSISS